MEWGKLLGELTKAMGVNTGRKPGDTGTGDFAEGLRGRTLRQFTSGSLGGSTERLLYLQEDGRCMYREVAQYDGGVVPTDPEHGTWWAEGSFPVGQLFLAWPGSGVSEHAIEYRGGDTCRLDGEPTEIR